MRLAPLRLALPLLTLFLAARTLVAQPVDNALLWEIRKPGSDKVSWLFGTIHLLPEDQLELPKRLTDAFDRADRLVLELDLDQAMDPAAQMALLPRMMMPDGTRLADLLEPDDHAAVMERVAAMGLPPFLAESIKPLFLAALADPGMDPSASGTASYDLALHERAKAQGKTRSGIEEIGEQLAAFDAIPLKEQARLLSEQLRATGKDSPLEDMARKYKSEDLRALQALMEEEARRDPAMMEALLYGRNRRWIPRMADLMAKESVFFAVGAGHLAGEEGVLNLLSKAGYRLKPVPVFR